MVLCYSSPNRLRQKPHLEELFSAIIPLPFPFSITAPGGPVGSPHVAHRHRTSAEAQNIKIWVPLDYYTSSNVCLPFISSAAFKSQIMCLKLLLIPELKRLSCLLANFVPALSAIILLPIKSGSAQHLPWVPPILS